MATLQDINVNVYAQPGARRLLTFVHLSQNENGRVLYFRILGAGPFPSGSTAVFAGTKPDGNLYSTTGTVNGNFIIVTEDIQMTAVAGVWDAKLDVINGDHNIMTAIIRVTVDADPSADAVESDSQLDGYIAQAKYYAENAKSSAYGSPLVAQTASAMTDTNKVYVYTGSENGYSTGYWYYYNGTAWTAGGAYNGVAVTTDTTLSQSGMAADAKSTGDALSQLSAELTAKMSLPSANDYGTSGQYPRSTGSGIEWTDYGLPSDEQTAQAVTDWLDAHPEATTSVEDGSLTYAKLVKGTLGFVMPQMFGASCDGVTDDAEYLQTCITYAAANSLPIKITNSIYVDSSISVPSYVRIYGEAHSESYPFIIAGENCSVVFNCTGICNIFKDFGIKNSTTDYRIFDGIVFNGSSNYDVDSEVINVTFSTMDRCVVVKGKNVKITDSFFGQSRIGVHFDLPDADTQYRGLQVENCRFHEIGCFSDLDWFENSACIKIADNIWSNLTVRNCIADQSGTFFSGYCTNGLIENNFVEAYKMPIIDINGVGLPTNMGAMLISGNTFNGKSGSVTTSVTLPYPEHIININTSGRVNIFSNIIRHSQYEMIALTSTSQITITSNFFVNAGASDDTRKYALLLDDAQYTYMIGNASESNGIGMYSADSTSIVSVSKNVNFATLSATNTTFLENDQWVLLGTAGGNNYVTFDLPNEFFVRLNDGRTCFHCYKYDDYITHGISFDTAGTTFYSLSFTKSNGQYVVRLKLHDVTNLSSPTAYGYTMYFYALRN